MFGWLYHNILARERERERERERGREGERSGDGACPVLRPSSETRSFGEIKVFPAEKTGRGNGDEDPDEQGTIGFLISGILESANNPRVTNKRRKKSDNSRRVPLRYRPN